MLSGYPADILTAWFELLRLGTYDGALTFGRLRWGAYDGALTMGRLRWGAYDGALTMGRLHWGAYIGAISMDLPYDEWKFHIKYLKLVIEY